MKLHVGDVKPETNGADNVKSEEIEAEDVKSDTRDDDGQPKSKRQKRAKKGQNKHRPIFRESLDDKLCRSLVEGEQAECVREGKCKFSHDLAGYLERKPEDIGEKCPIYSTNGFCSFGITCRFGKCHLTTDNKNLNINNVMRSERQHLPWELQTSLRKKTYDYSKSDRILKEIEKLTLQDKDKPVGSAGDVENVKTRPEEKKKVDFSNKLVLSPLTTVGNLPFRRICKEYGADITVGEMACSLPIINGQMGEWALAKRHSSENVFGVQICGNNSKIIAYAAQVLSEKLEVDFIDLNIGCPIDLIYKQGGGSALIRRQNVLQHIVRTCSTLLEDKPFTVKTRTGVYANDPVAHELLPKLEEWGASAVTLHGRSRFVVLTPIKIFTFLIFHKSLKILESSATRSLLTGPTLKNVHRTLKEYLLLATETFLALKTLKGSEKPHLMSLV